MFPQSKLFNISSPKYFTRDTKLKYEKQNEKKTVMQVQLILTLSIHISFVRIHLTLGFFICAASPFHTHTHTPFPTEIFLRIMEVSVFHSRIEQSFSKYDHIPVPRDGGITGDLVQRLTTSNNQEGPSLSLCRHSRV